MDHVDGIGMLPKIEVIPWPENAEFLHHVYIDFERVCVPTPRGMMEDSKRVFHEIGNE